MVFKRNKAQMGENAVKSRAKAIAKRKATQAQFLPDANQPVSAKRASIAPTTFVSEDTRRKNVRPPPEAQKCSGGLGFDPPPIPNNLGRGVWGLTPPHTAPAPF